jgi:DNA processing protein
MADLAEYSLTTKVVALARFGQVSPRVFDLLLRRLGDLDSLLSAEAGLLSAIEGISSAVAGRVANCRKKLGEADVFVKSLGLREIGIAARFDDLYPQRLFELNDPPLFLLSRGRLIDPAHKAVAIVGADRSTNEGIQVTTKLTRKFVKANVQVLGSLHGGIAAATHLAARSAGATSFAVIDSGFDLVAVSEEMALAIDIAAGGGGVISEYFPDAVPSPDSLSQSNRLLVGMADAVVFTELYADSKRALDVLECCNQVGKLAFFFVDPEFGALADDKTLAMAVDNGAIPMRGYGAVGDIVKSMV